MNRDFQAPYDKLVKIITFSYIAVNMVLFFYGFKEGLLIKTRFPLLLISSILLITALITYGFAPLQYTLSQDTIIIKRLFSDIKIRLSEIKEIKKMEKKELKNSIRVFGSGGLFGFFGIFYKPGLGKYFAYCSNTNDLIMIRTGKIFLISPEESDTFISMTNEFKRNL